MMDDDVRAQFARLGVEPSKLPPSAPVEANRIEVWAPNWPALLLFLGCETQWQSVATMGRPIWVGLNYAHVEITERRLGIQGVEWRDLQEMESAALKILNSGAGS